MSRLVWVPRGAEELTADPTVGVEIVEIPADPASDARLGEVEMLVAPLRSSTFDATMQFGELWDRMSSLRVVQVLSAGVDWIVDSVPSDIVLCSARGAHTVPVAEWVLTAILSGVKELERFRDDQVAGRWDPRDCHELAGAEVMILGHGSIGHAVEQRLRPFGPTIRRVARHAREGVATMEALPEMLPQADVVVLLLPLTADTERIVDDRFLARMRSGALLVNAARGRLVDTDALIDALHRGRVRAVLDVTDPEPLPAGHPLWRAPGLLITPHVAGGSPRSRERVFALVRAQIERFARDEPLENVVRGGY